MGHRTLTAHEVIVLSHRDPAQIAIVGRDTGLGSRRRLGSLRSSLLAFGSILRRVTRLDLLQLLINLLFFLYFSVG